MNRLKLLAAACALLGMNAFAGAASPPDFSGTWMLDTKAGANLGMMAALEMTVQVSQTPKELSFRESSSFQGQPSERKVRFDLTGRPVQNPGAMGDPSETVSKWEGDRLVTTWTSEGAVAGTKTVRKETRSLTDGGRTMSVETIRGANKPVVMVFRRK